MPCRTIARVQIVWPTTTITIPVGTALPVTGHYDLVGGGNECAVTLGWAHIAPGAPFGFGGSEFPAAEAIDYSRSYVPDTPGVHTLQMYALNVDGQVNSDPITVNVIAVPVQVQSKGQWVVYRDIGARREFQKLDGSGAWTGRQKEALKFGLESEAIALAKIVGGTPSRKDLAFAMHEHGPATSSLESVDLGSGTAFYLVQLGEETLVSDYDIYICVPYGLDTALLEASTPPSSLKLKYVICPLMPRAPSPYYDLQRAAVSESDYWHSALPYDETTRIPTGPVHWYLKPSATLGHNIADFFIDNFGSYFDGGYSDESHGGIPPWYWAVYSGAHDYGGEGQPYWEAQWDAMLSAFFSDVKAAFGTGRALIANSAAATYAGIDGITIEAGTILAIGEAAAIAKFQEQKSFWQSSANRYGSNVLNVAWGYDLNIADLVYRGFLD